MEFTCVFVVALVVIITTATTIPLLIATKAGPVQRSPIEKVVPLSPFLYPSLSLSLSGYSLALMMMMRERAQKNNDRRRR